MAYSTLRNDSLGATLYRPGQAEILSGILLTWACAQALQEVQGLPGLRQRLRTIVHDQRDLWHLLNPVSARQHQRWHC